MIETEKLSIREISPADTWQIRHEVMWPNKPFDYVKLEEDNNGIHFGVYLENALVAIVSVFIDGDQAQFRKFATLAKCQGKGIGTLLLNHIIEFARQKSIAKIWCNARKDKTDFYRRFGLIETDTVFEKGGIDYVIMERFFD